MRRDELKPCPFCGGTPFIQPNGRLGFKYWEVVCDSECDFTGPARDSEEEAAAAWNRRSSAALSIEQTEPVKVKPLEWSDVGSGRWRGGGNAGSYEVWHQWASDGKFHVSVHLAAYTDVMVGNGFPTLEAAKAAAQQDYETRIRSALVNAQADADVVERLDTRMKAAGMYTIAEMMGVTPLTKWMSNPAINTVEAFSEWLDRKVSEYLRMKAAYDLGDKDESDELYEWVQAHSAVFSTIRDQFQVVLSSLRPAEVGSATTSSGAGGEA